MGQSLLSVRIPTTQLVKEMLSHTYAFISEFHSKLNAVSVVSICLTVSMHLAFL